jgi:hypothetical protein
MLFRKIIAVYSENYTKDTNKICVCVCVGAGRGEGGGSKAEILQFQPGGI